MARTSKTITTNTSGVASADLNYGTSYTYVLKKANLPADVNTMLLNTSSTSIGADGGTVTPSPSAEYTVWATSSTLSNQTVTATTSVDINLTKNTSTSYTGTSDVSWITKVSNTNFIVAANSGTTSREGTITFTNGGGKTATYTVTQSGVDTYSVTFSIPLSQGTGVTLSVDGSIVTLTKNGNAYMGSTSLTNGSHSYTVTPSSYSSYYFTPVSSTMELENNASGGTLVYTAYTRTNKAYSSTVTVASKTQTVSVSSSNLYTDTSTKATVTTGASWLTVGTHELQYDSGHVYTVQLKPTSSPSSQRSQTVTMTVGTLSSGITVTQKGPSYYNTTFNVSPSSLGSVTLYVDGTSYSMTAGTSKVISLANGSHSYYAVANTTTTTNSVSVSPSTKSIEKGGSSITDLTASASQSSIGGTSGTKSVTVNGAATTATTIAYTTSTSSKNVTSLGTWSSDKSWLTKSSTSNFSVSSNASGASRSATISCVYDSKTGTCTVNQAGVDGTFSVSLPHKITTGETVSSSGSLTTSKVIGKITVVNSDYTGSGLANMISKLTATLRHYNSIYTSGYQDVSGGFKSLGQSGSYYIYQGPVTYSEHGVLYAYTIENNTSTIYFALVSDQTATTSNYWQFQSMSASGVDISGL